MPTGSSKRSLTMGKRRTEATANTGRTVKVMMVMFELAWCIYHSTDVEYHKIEETWTLMEDAAVFSLLTSSSKIGKRNRFIA